MILYNIIIQLYFAGISVYSLWNAKARKWLAGRNENKDDRKLKNDQDGETLWFHCASVGEYEQALPLVELLETEYPNYKILITFFSPSGYEYASQKELQHQIAYLPLDTSKQMKAFISKVNPKLVFIIKYEFWYHMLSHLHQRKIPVFLVSGIFRKQQLFFSAFGLLHRKMLSFFTHFFVQNIESKSLLQSIQFDNSTVCGDTRIDRVLHIRNQNFDDPVLNSFVNTEKVFVAGSVWNSDITALKCIMASLPNDWKIILAPHEPDHFNTAWIAEPLSTYRKYKAEARILIVDTIGLLSKIYRYAYFVYVGGGFGKSIHNVLEPAVYMKPILIGPKFKKFQEAVALIQVGGIREIDSKNATEIVKNFILSKKKYSGMTEALQRYISTNTNVSEKILVYLKSNYHLDNKVF